jgi:ribonucleoside-triphosphate reductase
MVRNFDNDDITAPHGHAFAVRLLDHLRERIVGFQERATCTHLEATAGG